MLDASSKITTGAVLAAAFLAATAFAQKPQAEEDARLQEARKLLQSTKEDQVRQTDLPHPVQHIGPECRDRLAPIGLPPAAHVDVGQVQPA